jgi:DNA-binding LytR/AlgR family response regulator
MRCIIVDDEGMARAHLEYLCEKIESIEIVGTFKDAMSAYRFLEKEPVDLAFLDIEMPDLTGIELVQSLQDPPAIIFITSKENYAIETFGFIETVVDYLLKPITLPRLLQAIQRYQQRSAPTVVTVSAEAIADDPIQQQEAVAEDCLFVKADRKYVRIDLKELLYVETVGDYSIFKTTNQQYTVHATLKSVLKRLSAPNFLKVHRSFIVNLDKIKDMEDSSLLIGDKVIPVSRNHRAQLMARIMPL